MSANVISPQASSDELPVKLGRRTRWLSITVLTFFVLFLAAAGTGFFVFDRRLKALEKGQRDLAFNQFVAETVTGQDFVQPTVNTIQFLHRGYSINFDKVEYTQNGLVLSGQIGNATNLWISSLALTFTARPYPYKIREKWEKENATAAFSPWMWWSDEWNIGKAETTVGALNPGSTSLFEVTIPNVKQTSDNMEIAVSFSGERYQYLGR